MINDSNDPSFRFLPIDRDARYDQRNVQIWWNGPPRVSDVYVEYVPHAVRYGHEPAPDGFWSAQRALTIDMDCDAGNSCADWCDGTDLRSTPAGVFGGMLLDGGFASPDEMVKALRQFAKIEQCEWAREVLASYVERPS